MPNTGVCSSLKDQVMNQCTNIMLTDQLFFQTMYTVVGALIHLFWVASFICFFSIVMTTFFERFSVIFKCTKTSWASFLALIIGTNIFSVDIKHYCDKIFVYDKHPLAGRDIQYRAPNSRLRYATPFDDILKSFPSRSVLLV